MARAQAGARGRAGSGDSIMHGALEPLYDQTMVESIRYEDTLRTHERAGFVIASVQRTHESASLVIASVQIPALSCVLSVST